MTSLRSGPVSMGVAVALTAVLAGCGSHGPTEATSSSQSSTSSAASPATANPTVADYLRDNNITQTVVKPGDPGAPQLNLPVPPGWKSLGAAAPTDAWGAVVLDAAGNPNPPAIIARMARLDGNVDQAKILQLSPNAVRNQPGFSGPDAGEPSKLAGFDAMQISGTLDQGGQQVLVARKTVVIPVGGAVYLLALDAQSTPDQQGPLIDAMNVIDAQTTFGP